jgi:hypothetical protein
MAGVKGKSGGDRRSKKAQGIPEAAPMPLTRSGYARLIDVLTKPPVPNESEVDPEAAGWRGAWDSKDTKVRLQVRFFMYRMRDGDPPRTLNYVHDKPLEVTMTLTIAETIAKARKRAKL